MRVAFDVDGVITRYPELFVELGQCLRAARHRVHIITGNRRETVLGARAEVVPAFGDPPGSWFDSLETFEEHEPERSLIAGDGARAAVGEWKRRRAAELEIDFMFDDDIENVRRSGGVTVVGVC